MLYVDSTPVSICENRCISSHKVAKGVASRDKSTKGWFYGFKLHGVCTDDSRSFADITEGLEGIFVADAGYLLKQDDLKKMYETGRKSCAAARKNMRRPMTRRQFQLLLKRNRIENDWSVMKLNYNLVYHRARSVTGIFRHFFYSISAFLLHSAEDAKQWFLPNLADVAKFEF